MADEIWIHAFAYIARMCCLAHMLKKSRPQINVVEEIVRYRLFTNGIPRISSIKLELNAEVIKIIVKALIFSAQVNK